MEKAKLTAIYATSEDYRRRSLGMRRDSQGAIVRTRKERNRSVLWGIEVRRREAERVVPCKLWDKVIRGKAKKRVR